MNRSGREDTQPASSPSTTPPSSAATTTTTAAPGTTAATAASAAVGSSAAMKSTVVATSTPSSLGASIHRVTSQLLTAPGDVRTPPKMRHQQESRDGQGVAVPVILEEDELEHPEEVLTRRSPLHPGASTSKPLEQGISTWVLLSGSHEAPSSTQPSPAPSPSKPTTPTTTTTSPKTTRAPTTKKPATKPPPTPTPGKVRAPSTTRKPLATPKPTTPKPTTTKPTTTISTTTAPTTTSVRPKPHKNKTTDVPALAPAMTRKPPTALQRTPTTPSTTTTAKATTIKEEPTTVLPIVTESPEEEPATTTEPENKTETSTRRTRRPGNGSNNKKKNKNKRRKNRPGANNGTAVAESKIGEAETNSTTKPQNKERPLSTRIYNYLAREVMPSFGVGLLGLAITAGLAGLIMYPFGGGAVKRTYEVDAPNLPQHGNFYYYGGEYDGEDHSQAEESVIRKVFEGMNSETDQPEDSRYDNQRYPAETDSAVASGTVTTYAGDVQANRYPTHRYDTGQTYSTNTGVHGSYSTGTAQNGYNRQDASTYYNTDQSGSYYAAGNAPSREASGGAPAPAATASNSTDTSAGGRVRYREVATGSVSDAHSPNPQQITKKSDYYGYNTGRVRFRDVGTGQVQEVPRVRFREVGSDAVHYSMSDAAAGESVEHGPRNVRVKRQLWNIKEMVKEIGREDKQLEEHARKMMDESKNMRNEVHTMHVKKNKPKKATDASTKAKTKQDEMVISNIFHSQHDILQDDEDSMKPDAMDAGESLVMIDDLTATELSTAPDAVDAEFVTGPPDTTEVEVLSINDNDESGQVIETGMAHPGGMMVYFPMGYMGSGFHNGMNAAVVNSNIGANLGDAIELMGTETEAMPATTESPVVTETSVTPETPVLVPQTPQVMSAEPPARPSMPQVESEPEIPDSLPESLAPVPETPGSVSETSESAPEMSATSEIVSETTEPGMDDDRLETTLPVTTIKSILDVPRPQITFIDIIKKIAQLKLQLGIGLLKSTSQAFTGYLDTVQKRMEDALKEARQASYRRSNFWNYRRSKREAKKNQTNKMKRKQG